MKMEEQTLDPASLTEAFLATQKIDRRRGPRKRASGWVSGLRRQFPPIPVRGLWDQASEEERGRAQIFTAIIMEYWMGQRTRQEAAEELELKPIRFWQLTQQAIAGMCAGLLTQPKSKGKMMGEQDVKKLKAKIQELEKTVETQRQLIAILRSMPGAREVKLEKTTKAISAKTRSGVEEKDRVVAKKRSSGTDE